ncbi:MAG: hypothetical protein GXP35_11275 [Actinobacteria bacterium]|nr:hypothetical protein [Actinomycetota bacterium]
MPARRVPAPPHRVADRMGKSSGWLVRVQGLAVALIASLPLTLAGHYLANVAVGTTERPLGVGAIWLVVFLVAGLAMMTAAIGSLLPDWHIVGGRIPVVVVLGGMAAATFDWAHLVDSWTGYAMNGAGVGAIVAGLQVVYWTPRSRIVRKRRRAGHRVASGHVGARGCASFRSAPSVHNQRCQRKLFAGVGSGGNSLFHSGYHLVAAAIRSHDCGAYLDGGVTP